jgi:hypothetical protein
MAENVISSGQYNLVGIDGEKYHSWRDQTTDVSVKNTDGFRYIWTTDGENSKEAVFEIQNEYLGLNWLVTRGSAVVWWTGARWIYDPANPTKGLEAGFWGFNIPSKSLLAEFNQEQRHAGDPLFGSLTPADPRFNTTIHKDTIGGNDSINLIGDNKWPRICYTFSPTQFNPTGMYQAKYECSFVEFKKTGANWSESPFNVKVMRYAEVILIAAEAAFMSGDNAKGIKYLNMVRTRARKCGPTGNTVPADLTTGDLTSTLNTPNGTVTMNSGIPQLIHDRRLELAMEGTRFYDLVRWNLATKYLNNQVLATGITVTYSSPKNDFYPIPQTEVNTDPKLLQYPGW